MKRPVVVSLFLALLPLLMARPAVGGPGPAQPRPTGLIDATLFEDPAWQSSAGEPIPVIVALEGPTALDLYRAAGRPVGDDSPQAVAARQDAFELVSARQAAARAFVEASGATILSTYDTATNGFLVLASREQVLRLTHTPGLRRIYRAPEHYPLLADAVPFVGGDAVAEQLGYTGRGVTIAIIDTGIDYHHASLGGSGRKKDFQDDNPRVIEQRSFPTAKVIGGWDFAGTNYTGGRNPQPDPDPLDERGHGSHVAGIAAGMTGNKWVYHGVAPDAYLIALKVFGRRGSTNLSINAIEWAIEANMGRRVEGTCRLPDGRCRVDVINLSLGSPWASGIMNALGVVRRAVEAGIVVVASAGNDGNVPYIHGSPAAAPDAVAVANTFAIGEKGDVVQVTSNGTTDLEALEGAASLSKQMSEVKELTGELAYFGRGCNADTPEMAVRGKVALIQRGSCTFAEKLRNAVTARAVAALVFDNGSGLAVMGANPPAAVKIPAYMITQTDGQQLRDRVRSGEKITVRMAQELNGTFARDYLADVINTTSSRGPSRLGAFKPNISAPGSNILAPQMGSGDRGVSLSGTSMAGPMVAGAAAVVIDRLRSQGLAPDGPLSDPGQLTALDVGALLMNYTGHPVFARDNRLEDLVPLVRQGAGRLDVLRAARGQTLLRAGPIASLNFGVRAVSDTYTDTATVTVRNLSSAEKRYAATTAMHLPDDEGAGVTYIPSPASFTVPAGGSTTVRLTAEAVSAALKPYGPYGGQRAMTDRAGLADAEMDGFLVVTEVDDSGQPVPDGDVARLPIYFLPRQASDIRLAPELFVSPTTGSGPAGLSNEGGGPGRAELFALLGEDGDEANVGPRLDVDLVGVRLGTDGQGRRTIEFLVHTRLERLLPFDSRVSVFLDTNRDGDFDWLVGTIDFGYLSSRRTALNGQQVTYYQAVTNNSPIQLANTIYTTGYYADMNMNSRTIILPVAAEQLGYDPGGPIAFDAAVMHLAFFSEVVGGTGNASQDIVPDDGLTEVGGQLSAGSGRLSFDSAALGYDFDRWSVTLAGGQRLTLTINRRSAELGNQRALASFPMNPPSSDLQVLTIVEQEPPTATPTVPPPTATPTEPPRPAGLIYLPVIQRRHFGWDR